VDTVTALFGLTPADLAGIGSAAEASTSAATASTSAFASLMTAYLLHRPVDALLLARHSFAPHHAPGRSARRTKTTTTAPTDGEYPITRALTPDRLFGSGSNNTASGSINRHITSRAGETASTRSAAVGQGGSNPQL